MSLLRRIEQGQSERQPDADGDADSSKLSELRMRRTSPPSGSSSSRDGYVDLKKRVQNKLLQELDPSIDVSRTAEVRRTIEELFESILAEEGIVLARSERRRLFDQIVAEILGLGPLEPLLADDTVTEIMVNGSKNIFIERKGHLDRVPVSFESDEHLMRIIDRIVAPLGRRIDESSPYVDARLQDGSRVNAVIPPISLVGPVLTIRKFSKDPITVDMLVKFGTLTPESVEFLKALVTARANIVISGGTGSGKTTLLNALSSFIPGDDRILTIENAAELQLQQEHVVTLESRPANIEGKGEITVAARRNADYDIISVQDSGPGVAAEDRDRVFEPLFTTKAKGTGLGLAICRQIIERHGGSVDLLDDGTTGATFRIRLPH